MGCCSPGLHPKHSRRPHRRPDPQPSRKGFSTALDITSHRLGAQAKATAVRLAASVLIACALTNPTTAQAAEATTPSYTVAEGDSLSTIAERLYGSRADWARLFDANRDQILNPNLIYPGQVIYAVDLVASPAQEPVGDEPLAVIQERKAESENAFGALPLLSQPAAERAADSDAKVRTTTAAQQLTDPTPETATECDILESLSTDPLVLESLSTNPLVLNRCGCGPILVGNSDMGLAGTLAGTIGATTIGPATTTAGTVDTARTTAGNATTTADSCGTVETATTPDGTVGTLTTTAGIAGTLGTATTTAGSAGTTVGSATTTAGSAGTPGTATTTAGSATTTARSAGGAITTGLTGKADSAKADAAKADAAKADSAKADSAKADSGSSDSRSGGDSGGRGGKK